MESIETTGLDVFRTFLEKYASGFLRNAHRDGPCIVCSAPTEGAEYCYSCNQHLRSGMALAHRVSSLVFAVGPERSDQMYKVMRGYKAPNPGPRDVLLVASLLTLALRSHSRCLQQVSETEGSFLWATVPSTSRIGINHPLNKLVSGLSRNLESEVKITVTPSSNSFRTLDPSHFHVERDVTGRHVLVIDDTWVTGSRAQSVAAQLLKKGASEVSILTVARSLRADWGPNKSLINGFPSETFNLNKCPWGYAECQG